MKLAQLNVLGYQENSRFVEPWMSRGLEVSLKKGDSVQKSFNEQ